MEEPKPCPFCVMDERVLKSNEHANLFLADPRKVEGHMLVTSRRHIEKPWETTDEELVAIFGLVRIAQQALVEGFGGGVDIRQHYRPYVPQGRIKVDHLHYHVLPRTEDDEFFRLTENAERPMYMELPEEELYRIERLFEGGAKKP